MADNTVEIAVKLALDQFRAAVDQLQTAFGGAMNKVEAEAAVTGGALDEAFRALGSKSVGQVEAEVRKLQTALATIRALPGVLPADAERATQAFNARLVELRASLGTVPPATREMNGALNQTAASLGNASRQMAAWAAAVVGVGGVTDLAKKVIETGSAFEQLEGRLASLLGSQEAASDAFARIKELAATTPFEVNALTEAYAKLTAFGMEPTMEQMRAFADTAATLGGGTQLLERVTLALGQAWTKGKLQGGEIMQMAEAGVPVWDLLAKATGRNVAELQKMSEAGQLGRNVIKQLIDEMGRTNAGASARLMDTFAGAVSNAKDATAEFFDLIARSGVLDYLKAQIQELLVEFDRMKQSGELEAKAKAIANAFLDFAEATKLAVETVSALSGVIKLAIEAFAVQKVLAFAGALRAIALAAPAAGAAVTVAGGQMAVAGTAAAGAAASLGLMARAFSVLKGLTLIGLAEGAIQLGAEFFSAKRKAEELDREVTKMLASKPAPVVNNIRDVVAETHRAKGELSAWQAGFLELQQQGKTTGEALGDLIKRADFGSIKGVAELAGGLDSVRLAALATGEQIDKALRVSLQTLTGKELAEFRIMAESAFAAGDISARALDTTLKTALDVSLKAVGVTAQATLDGMSQKFAESKAHADNLVASFDLMQASGIDASGALGEALEALTKSASTAQDFAAVADMVRKLGDEGLLAKEKVTELLDAIQKKSDDAAAGINSVSEALRVLGVKSQAELQKVTDKFREANDVIQQSTTATLREKQEAFAKYASAAIEANDGVINSFVKAKAESMGLTVEIDEAGKATVRLKAASGDLHRGFDRARESARGLAADTARAAKEARAAASAAAGMGGAETGGNYAAMGVNSADMAKAYGLTDSTAIAAFSKGAADIITQINAETSKALEMSHTVSGSAQTVIEGQQKIDALLKSLASGAQRDADTLSYANATKDRILRDAKPTSTINLTIPGFGEVPVQADPRDAQRLVDQLRRAGAVSYR